MSEEKLMEQCSDITANDLSASERERIQDEILKGRGGSGEIYRGSYYKLNYSPILDGWALKCIGVYLSIHKNNGNLYSTKKVYFKTRWLNKTPFSKRLEEAIAEQKNTVTSMDKQQEEKEALDKKRKVEHDLAVKQHIENVRKCTLHLDQTIKNVAQDAKPSAEEENQSQILFGFGR